jgi:MoxR-like ATPase
MALEDGRFLMHHQAYDALLNKGLTKRDLTERKLLRCHEDFRVIALGLPVPRFPGYTLDPPLRSRFQSRAVLNLPLVSQMEIFGRKYQNVEREILVNLLSARETLRIFEAENANSALSTAPGAVSKMPHFPSAQMEQMLRVLNGMPVEMQRRYVSAATLHQVYPFTLLCDSLQTQTVYEALDRFHIQRAVRKQVDQSGRTTIVVPDLTRGQAEIWIDGEVRVEDAKVDDSLQLVRTPAALTSTPEQTLELIKAQQRLPTSELVALENKAVVERRELAEKQQYRLPQGKQISLTLTTSASDSNVSGAPLTHSFTLQGSLGPASSLSPSSLPGSISSSFVLTGFHRRLLAPLLLDLSTGKDVCLIGGKGLGKSAFARYLAEAYLRFSPEQIHTVHLFKDMSSRDLLQRRSTDAEGNTVWHTAEIVNAALTGGLAILDGLERVPPATLQVLRRLIEDRELTLFDGTRLLRHDRYLHLLRTHTPEELGKLRIFPVLPSFRVLALACPPSVPGAVAAAGASGAVTSWLLEETLPLFSFHQLGDLTSEGQAEILKKLFPQVAEEERRKVIRMVEHLNAGRPTGETKDANAAAAVVKAVAPPPSHAGSSFSFSLRQCIQLLTHHAQYPEDLLAHVRRMCLYEFLPLPQKNLLDSLLESSEYGSASTTTVTAPSPTLAELTPRVVDGCLHIGSISYPISSRTSHPELVPRILFTNIPSQLLILQDLLKDWLVDAPEKVGRKPFSHRRHLLLIGNQGVGKNKLADRLLELLRLEREYMQLHRDTTVQSLTLSPSLSEGRIRYEDSALVRSVRLGRVLVIDECDKAPLEVVAILKGLVQDGEMALADGRKIIAAIPPGTPNTDNKLIPIHPEFRLIVLANRPGFPFLGNDFFKAIGDVFSVHSVPNPEPESEVELLRSYGKEVPLEVLRQLVEVFNELRHLVLEGTFVYPYSTRELVAIVKHLSSFPADGLLSALDSVLDFDRFDPAAMRNLREVFARHGIPLMSRGQQLGVSVELAESTPLPQPRLVQTWTSTEQPRGGLSSNPTSGTSITGGATGATPGLGKRLMHTASAALSAITGQAVPSAPAPSSSSSSSIPSVLSSTPLTARSWTLHLDGQVRTNESFENRRLNVFTEEKSTWKVSSGEAAQQQRLF